MNTLSLVMIVRNEARCLARCLENASSLVDEIIIVDTGSTDQTKQIAASYGAKVFDYAWTDHFAEARNYALSQATGDWNLVLDADEVIDASAGQVLREFIAEKHAIGKLKIVNRMEDDRETQQVQNFIPRVFPQGVTFEGRIHEQIVSDLPRIILPIEVQHDGYDRTDKSARNIPLLEQELQTHPKSTYLLYQLAKENKGIGSLEQAEAYMTRAYGLLTKKESYAPLVVVDYLYLLMEMKKFKQGLEVIVFEQSFLNNYPDFHFVTALFYLELMISDPQRYLHFMPRIEQAYKRCLEIGEVKNMDSVIGTGSFAALHNLGVFYEVKGNQDQAIDCYRRAAALHYPPSLARLQEMGFY